MSVSAIVNRLVELIETVDDIGRVYKFSPRDHDDIAPLIRSSINGVDVTRAWWVQGPSMEADWITRSSPQHVSRLWTFEIHGLEGMAPGFPGDTRERGGDLQTIRDNAEAICDAIDADDLDLGGTVFASSPCRWSQAPHHKFLTRAEMGVAYVVISKQVQTMPERT